MPLGRNLPPLPRNARRGCRSCESFANVSGWSWLHRRNRARLVKSVGSLQKDSVAIDRISLKLLETIDGIRVEMPPAAADTQADGIGELVGSDGLQLEPVAAAGRRVDAEREEMVVDRLLRERTHVSGVGGEPHVLAQHQVRRGANTKEVPGVPLIDDGNRRWDREWRLAHRCARELDTTAGRDVFVPTAVTRKAAKSEVRLANDGVA